jgi:aminopeptidase
MSAVLGMAESILEHGTLVEDATLAVPGGGTLRCVSLNLEREGQQSMTDLQQERYADLLIWCIAGAAGRRIVIKTEPIHREFAVELARRAYKQGAELVTIDYEEPLLVRARVELAADDSLSVHPDYARAREEEHALPGWSLIRIAGSGEPDHLKDMNPDRVSRYARSFREVMMPLSETVSRFVKHWVGSLCATPALATRAFPELDPAEARERYDAEIVRVLALDEPDPILVWTRRFDELAKRRDRLNNLELDEIHLKGPGTDLRVGLLPAGRWATAEAVMPDGRTVHVNMPSLEVFTTPDLRRTAGRVAATRPYVSTSSPGALIRGAWFEFDEGAVVASGADEGEEILKRVLDMDPEARFLGELALVDSRSAVASSNLTFFNTLYDENAAIHMALGHGFPRLVEGAEQLEPAKLIAMGINHSLVHDDVMIGSTEIDVDGITRGGATVPLMRGGRFVDA